MKFSSFSLSWLALLNKVISKLLSNSLYHPPKTFFFLMVNFLNQVCFSCVCIFWKVSGVLCLGWRGGPYASVISSESINYKALEIKSILGKKSAIIEEENRTKTDMTCYHTFNPPKPSQSWPTALTQNSGTKKLESAGLTNVTNML